MTSYPNSIVSYTSKDGGSVLSNPDHAANHNSIQDEIVAMQTVSGTTQGTNIFRAFSASDQPLRHQGGTLQDTINKGTINASVIGTPAITGGTVQNALVGTSTIQGGTANNVTMGTQNALGGTFGTPTLVVGSDAPRDLYIRSAAGTLTRLAAGTAGQLLQTNGTANDPTWSAPNTYAYNALANYTITSATFVSLDGTNTTKAIVTTNSNKVRVGFHTSFSNNRPTDSTSFQIVRNPSGAAATIFSTEVQMGSVSVAQSVAGIIIDSPSSGTNTYDLQVKVQTGTAAIGSGVKTINFSLEEIKQG